MLATKPDYQYQPFEGLPAQAISASEMSLEEIQQELGTLAPHIGQMHQRISAQQAHLNMVQERTQQLIRAARVKNPEFQAPQGLSIAQKLDVHVVGGPSFLELMLRDWREITLDALEINAEKLSKRISPYIIEREGQPELLEGMNLPVRTRKVEVLNFDYQALAALPLPEPTIVIKPEPTPDPLGEELPKT